MPVIMKDVDLLAAFAARPEGVTLGEIRGFVTVQMANLASRLFLDGFVTRSCGGVYRLTEAGQKHLAAKTRAVA
jgi:hypothetical protein